MSPEKIFLGTDVRLSLPKGESVVIWAAMSAGIA